MDFIELRQRYKALVYQSFEYQVEQGELQLRFWYQLVGESEAVDFRHQVRYQFNQGKGIEAERIKDFEPMIFNIGLVETINYWKLACPKQIQVKAGKLDQRQESWFKKLFYHGLGEFIYLNQISDKVAEDHFVEFVSDGPSFWPMTRKTEGNLIPVGGGKDSVVTLELLREFKQMNIPFVMNPPQAAYDCITVAGYQRYLLAKRVFDPKLFDLNQQGYLNGHVPFSAILGFISVLAAAISGKRYIALSNERSANEPSVLGTSFNHQYSKSYEFEKDFNDYVTTYLSPQISYFSLLRPMYEINIGKVFARLASYHAYYRSCNRGKNANQWCGQCAKCLFVYIILSPFVKRSDLIKQFGKDLLEDEALIPIFDELIGLAETKPFECVGTVWEVRYSLNQALQSYGQAALLDYYVRIGGDKLPIQIADYEDTTFIPAQYQEVVEREMMTFE